MKKYTVYFTDKNGATSPIGTVTKENYTADQYIADCKAYADDDWNQMLEEGEVTLEEIDILKYTAYFYDVIKKVVGYFETMEEAKEALENHSEYLGFVRNNESGEDEIFWTPEFKSWHRCR